MMAQKTKKRMLHDFNSIVSQAKIKVHPTIRSCHFGGQGLGIEGAERQEVGIELIRVPPSGLIRACSVSEDFCPEENRKGLSVHALLAAYIAFSDEFTEEDGKHAIWKFTWPSFDTLKASLPMLWTGACREEMKCTKLPVLFDEKGHAQPRNPPLQAKTSESDDDDLPRIIPVHLGGLVEKQLRNQEEDFNKALDAIEAVEYAYYDSPEACKEQFLYAWCIVNTRCVYYKDRRTQPSRETPKEDNMALSPLIDLFNHQSSPSCTVEQEGLDLVVKASEKPPASTGTPAQPSQLFVTYGAHSNDTLLAEYGFLLPDSSNIHDDVNLDQFAVDDRYDHHLQTLDYHNYLGNHLLLPQQAAYPGPCHRTEISSVVDYISEDHFQLYMWGDFVDEDLQPDERTSAALRIFRWVTQTMEQAADSIDFLEEMATNERALIDAFFGDSNPEPAVSEDVSRKRKREDSKDEDLSTKPAKEFHALSTARTRHGLILTRWKQIHDTCETYLASERMVELAAKQDPSKEGLETWHQRNKTGPLIDIAALAREYREERERKEEIERAEKKEEERVERERREWEEKQRAEEEEEGRERNRRDMRERQEKKEKERKEMVEKREKQRKEMVKKREKEALRKRQEERQGGGRSERSGGRERKRMPKRVDD